MLNRLKTWLLVTLAISAFAPHASALPTPQLPSQLSTESFEQLRGQWDRAMDQRGRLAASLSELEQRYLKLTGGIARMKAQGADSRTELEGSLRRAKALAGRLQGLQAELSKVEGELGRLSRGLVGQIDAERQRLERGLVTAPEATIRARLVMDLNALSAQRERYILGAQPREALAVGELLADAQALEDPNDMLAMADELQDTEAQVQQKLAALESDLSELRSRRRLFRRASRFAREESFFEEGDRARVYASRVATGRGQQPERADQGAQGGDRPNATPTLGGERQSPDRVVIPGGDPPERGAGSPVPAGAGDPGQGFDELGNQDDQRAPASPAPPLADAPGQPSVAPAQPEVADPFDQAPGSVIVVDPQADPNVSTATVQGASANGLDEQIRRLERQKKALKKQARTLRQRARGLRQRASDLD